MLSAMGVSSSEKAGFDSYQLREVDQVWYTHFKDYRLVELALLSWKNLQKLFLDITIPVKG